MRAHLAAALRRYRHRDRIREGEDEGFTLIETLVTLVIISVIVPIVLALVTNLFQQSQNVHDTMTGVQQDQTAGQALMQYLHAAIVILPGSNATTLNASILAGVNSSGTAQTATLQAVLHNSGNPTLDATFTTSLTPDGGVTTSIGTYDAVNSSAVFTYFYNNYSTTPVGLASTTAPTNAQLSEIVAVAVDVTFLAGPHVPTYGFHAVRASNFQTTIYLQNAAGAPAPTSSISVTASGTHCGRLSVGAHRDRQPGTGRRERDLQRESGRNRAIGLHSAGRREHHDRNRRLQLHAGLGRHLQRERLLLRHQRLPALDVGRWTRSSCPSPRRSARSSPNPSTAR